MYFVCVDGNRLDSSHDDVLVMCTKDEGQDAFGILFPPYKMKVYICVEIAIT